MRYKDEAKQKAIIEATVKLVNEIGFVASSVAKIAKEAKVSPATIYIYYENKEDLLVSTYIDIKQKLTEAILKDFDDSKPVRDIMRDFWINAFDFISRNGQNFQYTEQFANSPYSSLVDKAKIDQYYAPIVRVMQRGIEQKIIKDVPFEILSIFIYYPIMMLANPRVCADLASDEKNIETAFNMAWDAIKL
jgi:AcrR family transcriptional regulator